MTKTKEVAKVSLPEGFTIRPLKMDDVDELAEMFAEVAMQMFGHSDVSAEEIRPGRELSTVAVGE